MAKLITKFQYLKPNRRQSIGGYVKYIATREGVAKLDDTQRLAPSTAGQQVLIQKILRDFPDTKEMLEYEDYLQTPNMGNASEFISRALEDNAHALQNRKTYADYIATRPRAQRFGSHGLFTDDGVQVQLSKVSEELNSHNGNVWTAIISLRREDAERLGFDSGTRWRDMLRTQTQALSENLKIPMENLRWFAAFHNEGHHPHVHLIAYSKLENEGYLTQKGILNLRSSFAKDIFAQDLLCVYEKETECRDDLRVQGREVAAEIVSRINSGSYDNPKLEELLLTLSDKLSRTSGKKVYGYLKADVKNLIDAIVDELSKNERISKLYELWYEQRENILRTYGQTLPPRVPLAENREFKTIRNAVIRETLNLRADALAEDIPDTGIPEPEPPDAEMESTESSSAPSEYDQMKQQAESGNRWAQYGFAKLLLDREQEHYNPREAVHWLTESARQGYTVAQYRLGKLFLRGEDVPKDVDSAIHWLEEAVKQDNHYAEYLLGKTLLKDEDVEQDIDRAVQLLTASANQHNQYAQYTLGKAYLDGEFVSQDIPKALELLEQSANGGFPSAQYVYGKLLYRGELIRQDIRRALRYLEQAAEKENAFAAYLAGKIRLTEDGYRDVEKALRWFHQAAEQGNDWAEFQLGRLYLRGKEVKKDEPEAMRWLTAAAEHGNQYAAQLLGSIRNHRNCSLALGSLRLIRQLGQIIDTRMEADRKEKTGIIDRRRRQQLREKRQAQGIKQ